MEAGNLTRVLVVEDSVVARDLLVYILSSEPGIAVVGTAEDGEAAISSVARLRPDVVVMDIDMPRTNGFDATRRIMEAHPTRIILVSASRDIRAVATSVRAMEAGALAVLPRPPGPGHPEFGPMSGELVQTVRLMSEVAVVRRWPKKQRSAAEARQGRLVRARQAQGPIRLAAIGASTGGPLALQALLSRLPADFPLPILVVQHMSPGFIGAFAEWLSGACGKVVRLAAHSMEARPGAVYVAPDGYQMGVGPGGGRIILSECACGSLLCPSVAHLLRSVATCLGPSAAGVLLTGMGRDGAEELLLMKERGAVTIAQERESCVVYGMPGEAVRLGAAEYILSPAEIAAALVELASVC